MTATPPDRTRQLLDKARYLNLATVSADGQPWVSTVEYAWLAPPLRFIFGSATTSRHAHHIARTPQVAGSLFIAGTTAGLDISSVDGAQFTGHCTEITPTALNDYYTPFYETVFPDPEQRAEWMLPRTQLRAPEVHRLYLIEVTAWWLIDTTTWPQDRIDRRIKIPLPNLPTL